MPLKIGLVGCGAIGAEIAKAIDSGVVDAIWLVYAIIILQTALALIESLQHKPKKTDLAELVEHSDVVVEAASQKAVPAVARAALAKGKEADDNERGRSCRFGAFQ